MRKRVLNLNHKLTINNDGTCTVSGSCKITNKPYSATFDHDGYMNWKVLGHSAQNALPNATANDREFLISGLSPEGFDIATKEGTIESYRNN